MPATGKRVTACRAGRPARSSTRFRRSGSARTPAARCRHALRTGGNGRPARCGPPRNIALSPVAAYRARTSFRRRTLFSMYESNGFITITHYITVTISVGSARPVPSISIRKLCSLFQRSTNLAQYYTTCFRPRNQTKHPQSFNSIIK